MSEATFSTVFMKKEIMEAFKGNNLYLSRQADQIGGHDFFQTTLRRDNDDFSKNFWRGHQNFFLTNSNFWRGLNVLFRPTFFGPFYLIWSTDSPLNRVTASFDWLRDALVVVSSELICCFISAMLFWMNENNPRSTLFVDSLSVTKQITILGPCCWSEGLLVGRVISPKSRWSEGSLVRKYLYA